MRSNRSAIWFALGVAVLALIVRLVPHAPNFVPVGALALFAGAYLPKRWGFLVPVIVMGVSDVFVGLYDFKLMGIVYGSFLVMVSLGYMMRGRVSPLSVGFGALGGSVFFFLATNFAVWAFSSWYPSTFAGLMTAYAMGLPFFRMTILGNLFYSTVVFGAYAALKSPVMEGLYRSAANGIRLAFGRR